MDCLLKINCKPWYIAHFSKRPLVFLCVSFIFGILLVQYAKIVLFSSLLIIFITAVFVSHKLLSCNRKHLYAAVLMIAALGAGYLRAYPVYWKEYPILRELDGKVVILKGMAVSEPEKREDKRVLVLKAEEVTEGGTTLREGFKVLVSIPEGSTPAPEFLKHGDGMEIRGKIHLPQGRRNPMGFDYRRYLKIKGIHATMTVQPYDIKRWDGKKAGVIETIGPAMRTRVTGVINSSLPEGHAGLLNGMLLGVRDGLSEELSDDFSRCGLSHIMCVSGMNVSFVVLFCLIVFRMLKRSKTHSYFAAIASILLFTTAVGFSPPVLRAALMGIIVLLGKLLDREPDIYTSVAFASLIILLVSPLTVFDIGFQLSFAGTISLVAFFKPIKKMLSFLPGFLSDVMACTIAAQVGVTPIILYYFNTLSIISLAANILTVPVTGVVTILGFVTAAAGHVSIELAKFMAGSNYFLLGFILLAAEKLSALPFAVTYVPTPSVIQICIYYVFIGLIFKYAALNNYRNGVVYALAAIVAAVMTFFPYNAIFHRGLEVTFLDVGEGDCAFIRTGGGRSVLIDTGCGGDEAGFDAGGSIVAPFLLDKGIGCVDLVVLTHGHADHTGGLASIVERIKVKNMMAGESEELLAVRELGRAKGMKLLSPSAGQRVYLDRETFLEVISAGEDFASEEGQSACNNSSYVIRLRYGDVCILFTGDIEKDAEEAILAGGRTVSSHILKVAHHGSASSTCQEFIEAVRPAASVVSVGRNLYGHPDEEGVLKRLCDNGSAIFRTDRCGAVIVRSDGKRLKISRTVPEET